MHLPISFSKERGKIETKILDFSNKLFKNLKFGICFALLINAIYLYFCYYKKPIIELFIFLYFLNLILHIFIYQFKENK